MARIRDRWHKAKPRDGEPECREHKSKSRPMVPTDRHGQGARWLLVYREPDGTERSEAFERLPDAEIRRDVIAGHIRTGDYIDPRLGRKLFRDLAGEWLDYRTVSAQSQRRERQVVEGILNDWFGNHAIADIRPSLVKQWQSSRKRTCTGGTVNLEMWTLGTILQTAVDDELIRRNPVDKVKRLPVPKSKVEPWTLDTIRTLLDWHGEHAPHVWPVPALAVGAGLRVGEAFGVGVDDIHFLKRELRVERQIIMLDGVASFAPPKRGQVGTVPLEKALCERLSAYLAEHEPVTLTLPWVADDAKEGETRTVRLLTVGRRGCPLRRWEFNRSFWHNALAAAGIERDNRRTGIHRLRHCYASYLIAEGKPLTVVAARLRDHLREVVETYGHLVEGEQIDGAIASLFAVSENGRTEGVS